MSQDQQPPREVQVRSRGAAYDGKHALVGVIAALGAALILDSLVRLVLAAALGLDTGRLSLMLGAFFFAEWAVLAALFLWKARDLGTVLWRGLLGISLEWFAVGASSLVLGPRLATRAGGYALSGLPFLVDPAAQRVRVFFQVNALLGFMLGLVFLIAAIFVLHDTYERS